MYPGIKRYKWKITGSKAVISVTYKWNKVVPKVLLMLLYGPEYVDLIFKSIMYLITKQTVKAEACAYTQYKQN